MIAALAVLMLGAEPSAPAHFVWPKPELIEEIEIPEVIQTDGVPVRLHSFRSRLGPQALLQTYATAFDEAGFYVALQQKRVVAEPHITGLDWRTKISYSAILSPNSDGTTSCLLGEAALGKRLAPAATSDFAPLMPEAKEVVRIDQEADRLITFSVRASVEGVLRFYAETLPTTGFTAAAPGERNTWVRGLEQLQLITRAKADGLTSVVLMHRNVER